MSPSRPVTDQSLTTILPRHATLRNKSNPDPSAHSSADVTLFRIASDQETLDGSSRTYTLSRATHESLVETMCQIMNEVIERGDTYPFETPMDKAQFEDYYFLGDAFVLLKGHYQQATEVKVREKADWEKILLGFFYIKPNFPGRSSHICNGGFVVNPIHRGLGVGSILGKSFLKLVPVFGYKASMFNLVFETNVASIRLWRRLGFKEIGRVPKAGRLRVHGASEKDHEGKDGEKNEGYVDAIQFYWDFETMVVPTEYDS